MKRPKYRMSATLRFKQTLLTVGVAALFVVPAWAEGLRDVDQAIFGMDCAPCAAGVEQGLSKLEGVTSVRVSLNEGKALVTLRPDSSTTLAQIRKVIRHNAFTPKDARVTLVGHVLREGNRLWIHAGKERFVIEGDEGALDTPVSAEESALSVRVPETLSNPPTVQLISHERSD